MITSTHRPHEHAVARGCPVNSLMAELFAKVDGCCGGKGGSMHLGDVAYGMLPAIAIVGGGIPLAAGYALSFKYRKTGNIVGCFFGDGATNIGSFHEGVNISAIWDLPVVFVCENNKYGASTAIEKVTRVPRLSDRAVAYGIPGPDHRWQRRGGVYRRCCKPASGPARRRPHVTGDRDLQVLRAIRAAIPGIIVLKMKSRTGKLGIR